MDMKNYFEYLVKIDEGDEVRTYQGVTYGETYYEAMQNVFDFFSDGEDMIISITLEELDACGCLILTKEAIKDIKDNL